MRRRIEIEKIDKRIAELRSTAGAVTSPQPAPSAVLPPPPPQRAAAAVPILASGRWLPATAPETQTILVAVARGTAALQHRHDVHRYAHPAQPSVEDKENSLKRQHAETSALAEKHHLKVRAFAHQTDAALKDCQQQLAACQGRAAIAEHQLLECQQWGAQQFKLGVQQGQQYLLGVQQGQQLQQGQQHTRHTSRASRSRQ